MSWQTLLISYLISVPVFFMIDMIWLGVVAQKFYQKELGPLLGKIKWAAPIVFYLIFLIGLVIFSIAPALETGDWRQALFWGSLYGFFTYATYDLTNLATLKGWSLSVVFVDIIWGTILGASVATITFLIQTSI